MSDENWTCEVCGWVIGHGAYMRPNGHHAAMGALRRERDEAVAHYKASEADYDNLVALLKKRFPQRPDGSLPDWKIEDVLEENATLKEKLDKWNRVMGQVLAGSEYINNPELYVERFRQLGEWHMAAVKRAKQAVAKLQRAREALEREEYRFYAVHPSLGDVYEALLADLAEGGDDAKTE